VVYPNSGREWDAVAKEWLGPINSSFEIQDINAWKSLGATVIGGCCGVSPSDIAQLKTLING
jgi:homocysteine S-methyltransferase